MYLVYLFLEKEQTSKVVFTLEKFLGKNAHDNDVYGTCLDYLGENVKNKKLD